MFSFALGLFPNVLAILVEFASNMAVLAVSSFPRMIGTLFPVLDMLAQYLGLVLSGRGLALALSARFALFAFLPFLFEVEFLLTRLSLVRTCAVVDLLFSSFSFGEG